MCVSEHSPGHGKGAVCGLEVWMRNVDGGVHSPVHTSLLPDKFTRNFSLRYTVHISRYFCYYRLRSEGNFFTCVCHSFSGMCVSEHSPGQGGVWFGCGQGLWMGSSIVGGFEPVFFRDSSVIQCIKVIDDPRWRKWNIRSCDLI